MAKFGLYSKNNLEEYIMSVDMKHNKKHLSVIHFTKLKNLKPGEFAKLFVVKEIK